MEDCFFRYDIEDNLLIDLQDDPNRGIADVVHTKLDVIGVPASKYIRSIDFFNTYIILCAPALQCQFCAAGDYTNTTGIPRNIVRRSQVNFIQILI